MDDLITFGYENKDFNDTVEESFSKWNNDDGTYNNPHLMMLLNGNASQTNFSSLLWRLSKSKKSDGFKKALDYLNLYLTPLIIVVGIVGNVMSFLVFSATYLKQLSSSVYLASLALVDTGFLITLFLAWLGRLDVPVFHKEGWCQTVVYVTYVCCFLSVWYVVSFTAERYIIVYHPLQKAVFCTKKRAKLVVVSLAAVALIIYSFAAWTSGLGKVMFGTQSVCMSLPQYYDVLTIMTSVDIFIAWVLPSMIIVVLNVRIIIKLHHYQSKVLQKFGAMERVSRKKSMKIQTSISTTGSMHIKFSSNNNGNSDTGETTTYHDIASPDTCQRILKNRTQYKTARMLLTLSSVFVLLNLPSHVFKVQAFFHHNVLAKTKSARGQVNWQEFFQLVYFLNFAINFFIYSACGRQFRVGLKRLCKRLKREHPQRCGEILSLHTFKRKSSSPVARFRGIRNSKGELV